jgi:hypothetical protein
LSPITTKPEKQEGGFGLLAAIARHGEAKLGGLGAEPARQVQAIDDLLHVSGRLLAQ